MESLISIINYLITKDTLSITLAVIATALAVTINFMKRKTYCSELDSTLKKLEKQTEKARRQSEYLSEGERIELFKKLDGIEQVINDYREGKLGKKQRITLDSESGFITHDFFLYSVPAIIALTFTFVLVYLLIVNQENQNYQSPEVLKTGLSTIIGYYFGVAVKEKPTSPAMPPIESLTPDDVKKMINESVGNT